MKATIEHPKVFISYAWGNKENQQKVLSFATELMDCGINVILDKWDLKEGNDKYAYMEKCVTDNSVTNVLLLLDENYTKKADSRTGGVGDETQIISPEIYGKVEQKKFLPVVFTRGENGEIFKPAYLKGMLHVDLSNSEDYDENFQYLVKKLYGVEIYKKPELGTKPTFVEGDTTIPVKLQYKLSEISKESNGKKQIDKLNNELNRLYESIVNFKTDFPHMEESYFSDYLNKYEKTKDFLADFLAIIDIAIYIKDGVKQIASFFENVYSACKTECSSNSEIKLILIHEMFISSIAILLKRKHYDLIGYLLGKTYFIDNNYDNSVKTFCTFYGLKFQNLDKAVNMRDNKNYITGTSCLWLERVNLSLLSKSDFVLADIICFNYYVLEQNSLNDNWCWFPKTYIYGNKNEVSALKNFAIRLVSKEEFLNILPMFNLDEKTFIEKYKAMETSANNGEFRDYRYHEAWSAAPLLCDYVKSEDICKYR